MFDVNDLMQSMAINMATRWFSSVTGGLNVRLLISLAMLAGLLYLALTVRKFLATGKGKLILAGMLLLCLFFWFASPRIGWGRMGGVRRPMTKSQPLAKKKVPVRAHRTGNGQLADEGQALPLMPMMSGGPMMPVLPVGIPVASIHGKGGQGHPGGSVAGGATVQHHPPAAKVSASHISTIRVTSAPPVVGRNLVTASQPHAITGAVKPAGSTVATAQPTPAASTPANGNQAAATSKAATTPAGATAATASAGSKASTPAPASPPAAAPRQRYGLSVKQLAKRNALRGVYAAPTQTPPSAAKPPGGNKAATKAAAGSQAGKRQSSSRSAEETPTTRQYGPSAQQIARSQARSNYARQTDQEFHEFMDQAPWHSAMPGMGGHPGHAMGGMPGHGMPQGNHPGQGHHNGHP